MKAALDKVRKAISQQSIASNLTHYLLKDERIYASDGRMMASAKFPSSIAALVPGPEFEMLVDRLGENIALEMGEDRILKLKAGRMRGTIRTLAPEDFLYIIPPDSWSSPPERFLEALRTVRPFISDNAVHSWALCAALFDARIIATTNVSLVEVTCPGLAGDGTLLPCWAIDFLLSRNEALVGMQYLEGAIAWQWEDGSWMRTQLVQGEFPTAAANILSNLTAPSWEISKEWRAAYGAISDMTADIIELHKDRMCGQKGAAMFEHEVESPVPENGVSKWTTKFLDNIVALATHWQPDAWPKPAAFIGPDVRGVIMGRS